MYFRPVSDPLSCAVVAGGLFALASSGQTTTFQFQSSFSTEEQGSKFGWSMAASPERVVVGMPFSNGLSGAVAVYAAADMANGTISPSAVLAETLGPVSSQRFGAAVACADDQVAVSNCSVQSTEIYCNDDASWVSIFTWSGSDWQETQQIQRPPWVTAGDFGRTIALSGDHLVVGGSKALNGSVLRDVVYIYEAVDGVFSALPGDSLDGSGSVSSEDTGFGSSLALSGNTLLVGARGDDELGTDAGAVLVYEKGADPDDPWFLVRKLLASNGSTGDNFGYSIAVNDALAAVGAPGRTINDAQVGSAYVLDRDLGFPNNWGEAGLLEPSTDLAGMGFGTTVAVGPGRVAVGAPQYTSSDVGTDGRIELFAAAEGGDWSPIQVIVPFEEGHVNPVSRSGTALAFSQGRLLVGAPWASITQPAGVPTGGVLVYTEGPVGMDEPGSSTAHIWPVPAVDNVSVRVPGNITGKCSLRLLDAAGRVLRSERTTFTDGNVTFPLFGIAAGSYVLQIIDASIGAPMAQGRIVIDR